MSLDIIKLFTKKQEGLLIAKDIDKILQQIAKEDNKTVDYVRKEIQNAIDQAYKSDNIIARNNFIKLFGNKNPTIEEFILRVTLELK